MAALVGWGVRFLLQSRVLAVQSLVIEGNVRGRRFYERAGWAPDGGRQPIDFDGVIVDEIRYRIA